MTEKKNNFLDKFLDTFLKLIKIYKNPTVDITLNGGRLNAFP
jgi:hypothetical protein